VFTLQFTVSQFKRDKDIKTCVYLCWLTLPCGTGQVKTCSLTGYKQCGTHLASQSKEKMCRHTHKHRELL